MVKIKTNQKKKPDDENKNTPNISDNDYKNVQAIIYKS